MGKIEILGVKIDNLTASEALRKVEQFMIDGKRHYIVTPNPCFLVKTQKDNEFKKILNQADLAIPDGVGLVFASWFLGQPLKQRITGIDLMEKICHLASRRNWPVFLLGGKEGAAKKAVENLKKRYKELEIKAVSENYLQDIILQPADKIQDTRYKIQDTIMFVAFGAPKQEKWIAKNLEKIPSIKLAMGLGGAFDFMAGKIPRAPKILRAIGLEWLWRLIVQPWRIGRIFSAVIVFPWLVIKDVILRRSRRIP